MGGGAASLGGGDERVGGSLFSRRKGRGRATTIPAREKENIVFRAF
jgi:hypothetical protein